ncbi:MAG: AraC family transcriptional regulator [Ruminococcaceae bacterium]|nr:AraC family transcriptional regulator [Oscillospiraceae bacterium]
MLKSGSETIIQCAYESGFISLRSFNRNFKQRFGVSPTEYRKNIT